MSGSFSDKVFNFTSKNALLPTPCRVLVGVSGGADSMALLHLLMHWPAKGLQVHAIHINHGLRGALANRDEQFVRDFCCQHNVPLTVIHEDVSSVAKEKGLTIEEAGRQIRYAHFETVRHRVGADFIVTAHTASDQAETVLMNMVRGCGLEGLTGIPLVRGNVCRPLLQCSRSEIELYCVSEGIDYTVDETNDDIRYTRNFVRHRVLPVLREINPSVDSALARLQQHCQEDSAYIQQVADLALAESRCCDGYRKSVFERYPSVVRRRMIRALFRSLELSVFEEAHIVSAEQAILLGNNRVSLPNGWVFAVGQELITLYRPDEVCPFAPQEITEFPAEFLFGSKRLIVEQGSIASAVSENVHSLLFNCVMDCDKIKGKLYLRCRQEGDYLHPSGRGVGKSLKKLMNEWRIPVQWRNKYPLLCDDNGVLLVPGFAYDERVKCSDTTKHYLVCKWTEEQG